MQNPAAYFRKGKVRSRKAVRRAQDSRECGDCGGGTMATRVAARKHGGGGRESQTDDLRRAGRTAGLSRVRKAAPIRSHDGPSFGRSGEARSRGAYSQPVHPVKQSENDPSVVYGFRARGGCLRGCPVQSFAQPNLPDKKLTGHHLDFNVLIFLRRVSGFLLRRERCSPVLLEEGRPPGLREVTRGRRVCMSRAAVNGSRWPDAAGPPTPRG